MRRRDLLLSTFALPFTRRIASAQATPEPAAGWAHPEWFADPAWLAERASDANLRIIALTSPDEFDAGHIPGAVPVDWPELELVDSAEATIKDWRANVEAKLTTLGVTRGSMVVIYDGGTFYAPRLWWVLHQLAHADKRVLDGGLLAWMDAEGGLEQGSTWGGWALYEPYLGTPNEDALARLDEVVSASEQGTGVLVDARPPEEFRDGRIPGAVNIPFTDNAIPDSGGRWKSPADLRAMYAAKDVMPDQLIIPYCTIGVRSAATYFTLSALGYEQVKLYSASYDEWSSDPSRPIETGTAP